MRPGKRSLRRHLASVFAAAALALLAPAIILAHPLGNFTINHFAAIRVTPERIALDIVIDRAEIPAFQELQMLDRDADGTLSASEAELARVPACTSLLGEISLTVDGTAVRPNVVAAGLSTLPGASGLTTMRLVCEFDAVLRAPLGAGSTIAFADRSFAERIGWREIVVVGDGATVVREGAAGDTASGDPDGISARLTAYPKDLLTQPLDMRSVSFTASPGGARLPPWTAPDAAPVTSTAAATSAPADPPRLGAVPGGVAENLATLIDVQELTPLAILASLAVAFGLGIVHAVSPGHGKTIMAAYLVGARGSSRQAIVLGLAVTVSHTLGVLALAVLTLAASSVLPPERLYPILGVVSGGLVIAIGSSLLLTRLRAVAAARRSREAAPRFRWTSGPQPRAHDHAHGHDNGHSHGHGHGHSHALADPDAGISRRGLIALGLSGGLVPSASALILLLGSIAAGRVAYGLVLVLGFGLGMAVVLAGIGLVIVRAKSLVDRRPSIDGLRRFGPPIQVATASLVVVLGIVLTGQALTQVL